MPARFAAEAAKPHRQAPPGGYTRRLAALARLRAWPILAFVLLLIAVEVSRAWSTVYDPSLDFPAFAVTFVVPTALLVGQGAVLGPLLAQAVGMHGVRGAALTVAATLLLVVAGAVAREWLLPMPAGHEFTGVDVQASAFFARNVWMMTMAGLLFAAYCTARERDAEATRAAREAELARARDERAMLESRLAIMHAHVEPQALFDALGDIVATCRDRPDEAYVRLDRLIDHLRAALPRLREGAEPSSAATPGPVACRRT